MKKVVPSVDLWQRFLHNKCAPGEAEQVLEWLAEEENRELKEEWIKQQLQQPVENISSVKAIEETWETIKREINQEPIVRQLIPAWVLLVAATIMVSLVGIWFITDRSRQLKPSLSAKVETGVPPALRSPTLTLANGTVIVLDSNATGNIALQGNTSIVKLENDQLAYKSANEKPGEVMYNTLVTPIGGQYHLVLPDGSRVWLNAASSLRFPAAFSGGQRSVELTGEAYFEVAHNSAKPFKVQVKNEVESMEIEVLGTHFNVSNYNNDPAIQAVLLKGSVRVNVSDKSSILRPGQQARAIKNKIEVSQADTAKAIAWKNGLFRFEQDNIKTIMNHLARWYDIEVEYQGLPRGEYTGIISRTTNLSEVLQMLKHSGLQFKLEGRKLIVQD